jgi:hypothetical protein
VGSPVPVNTLLRLWPIALLLPEQLYRLLFYTTETSAKCCHYVINFHDNLPNGECCSGQSVDCRHLTIMSVTATENKGRWTWKQDLASAVLSSVDRVNADFSGLAFWGVGLLPLAWLDCGFESPLGHGCLTVVCCQVEVYASGWSLVQGSPAECGVCGCDREAS